MIHIRRAITSLSELVVNGKNGVIFKNAAGLVDQLEVIHVPYVFAGILIIEISIIADSSKRVSKNAHAGKSTKFVQAWSRP